MHYPGTHQNNVAKVVLSITALELGLAAAFYFYWGFKIGNSNTIVAAEKSNTVLAATGALFGMLIGFAGFTTLVMKKTYNRCVTTTYSFMLFFALMIFGGIAFSGRFVRDQVA